MSKLQKSLPTVHYIYQLHRGCPYTPTAVLNSQEESQQRLMCRKHIKRLLLLPPITLSNFGRIMKILKILLAGNWLKGFCLNKSQNTTVPGLYAGSERNILMKLIGICLQWHQLDLTRKLNKLVKLCRSFRMTLYHHLINTTCIKWMNLLSLVTSGVNDGEVTLKMTLSRYVTVGQLCV